MKIKIILATVLLACSGSFSAAETGAEGSGNVTTDNSQMTRAYDKAFELYTSGSYLEAIKQWDLVLRIDPDQVTAKNMIGEARRKLAGTVSGQKGKFYALVARGRYSDALLRLETMTAADPSNPALAMLSGRLQKIARIVKKKPSRSKAWNVAALGVYYYVNEDENLAFAYDAVRYAAELRPREARFVRLTAVLESEFPQLKLNDTKPPQVGVLEHKKDMGLRYIYDARFYMAVRELESALKLEPDDPVALKRLGSAYLKLKDYPKARKVWSKALRLTPEDEQLKSYLAALNAMPKASRAPKKTRKSKRKARSRR